MWGAVGSVGLRAPRSPQPPSAAKSSGIRLQPGGGCAPPLPRTRRDSLETVTNACETQTRSVGEHLVGEHSVSLVTLKHP